MGMYMSFQAQRRTGLMEYGDAGVAGLYSRFLTPLRSVRNDM